MEEEYTVFTCNVCGKKFDLWDAQNNLHISKDAMSYGSKHDGEKLDLWICCDCMDKLVDKCVVSPIGVVE